MGFNATVVVLLDRLSEIELDPHFGKKLCDAIRYQASYRERGEWFRAVTEILQHITDHKKLCVL
jgi:hypothetical protein